MNPGPGREVPGQPLNNGDDTMNFFTTLEAALDQKIQSAVNKALAEAEASRSLEGLETSLLEVDMKLHKMEDAADDLEAKVRALEEGDGFEDAFRDFMSNRVTVSLDID